MLKVTKLSTQIVQQTAKLRHISSTVVCLIDQKWREKKGLAPNPNEFGPLTNLPDYTFLDGRPTPLGSNQKKRLIKQQEIAAKIVSLSSELNYGKERHARLKAEDATEKQRSMQSKLKPKGHLLLKKN